MVKQINGEKIPNAPPNLRDAVQNLKIVDAIKRSSDDMMWASV
jgi:hypothetical protein